MSLDDYMDYCDTSGVCPTCELVIDLCVCNDVDLLEEVIFDD